MEGPGRDCLKKASQLEGDAGKLPPTPQKYDVDQHGSFSAGKFSGPRSTHPTHKRTSRPSDGEIDAESLAAMCEFFQRSLQSISGKCSRMLRRLRKSTQLANDLLPRDLRRVPQRTTHE
jgi:hypothetical protein